MGGTSKLSFPILHPCSVSFLLGFSHIFVFFFSGTPGEKEEKVSLDLSEEILLSMEVGMSFKDYVNNFYYSSVFLFNFFLLFNQIEH